MTIAWRKSATDIFVLIIDINISGIDIKSWESFGISKIRRASEYWRANKHRLSSILWYHRPWTFTSHQKCAPYRQCGGPVWTVQAVLEYLSWPSLHKIGVQSLQNKWTKSFQDVDDFYFVVWRQWKRCSNWTPGNRSRGNGHLVPVFCVNIRSDSTRRQDPRIRSGLRELDRKSVV